MQWEIRHLAGDDIVAIRITGRADVAHLAAACTEARTLAARMGASKFMADLRHAHCVDPVESLSRAFAQALLVASSNRLAVICDAPSGALCGDEAPEFGAKQLMFSRTSSALYWLAGRQPRHQIGRSLIPAAA